MTHYEIRNYMYILCEMTNKNLNELVHNNFEYLPFFIMINAQSCYVQYDTQEEVITEASLQMMNKDGLSIVVDPIRGTVTGFVAGENSGAVEMQTNTADTLLACITTCWKARLREEVLISINSDGRFIAADLLG